MEDLVVANSLIDAVAERRFEAPTTLPAAHSKADRVVHVDSIEGVEGVRKRKKHDGTTENEWNPLSKPEVHDKDKHGVSGERRREIRHIPAMMPPCSLNDFYTLCCLFVR